MTSKSKQVVGVHFQTIFF